MSTQILIVEDDAMIQGFLRLTLENAGYGVTAAQSAAEMRVHFQKGGVDLVILDLGLPDADGLDLVTEIRAASSIPIVVASARQGTSDRVSALERGADDYLTKPFDPAELLLRLKNLISRCSASPVADSNTPSDGDRRGRSGDARQSTGDRRAQPKNTGASGDRRAGFAAAPGVAPGAPIPPVPPALHSEPVSPLPATPAAQISPTPATTPVSAPKPASAEESLQAAALKSAPQPISQAPTKASVDKSVIFAGILAVAAFGGAGIYWFTNNMTDDRSTARPALERPLADQSPTQPDGQGQTPRRGALQPPSEPDVRIAQSTNSQPPQDPGNLTRSVTSVPQQAPQVAPQPETTSLAGLPSSSTAWVKDSKCAPLPNVKWWRVKTHQQVVRFVNREHDGEWQPYLNSWRARIDKLKDISDRGSGIKTSSGVILQGDTLASYIRDTADRIAIIQCLAREARVASGS